MEKNLLVFCDVTLSTGDLYYFYHLLYHLLFLSGTCTISSSTVPFLCRPSLLSPPIPISIGHLHYLLLDHLLLWEMSAISSISHLHYLLLEHLLLWEMSTISSISHLHYLLLEHLLLWEMSTISSIGHLHYLLLEHLLLWEMSTISTISSSTISFYGKCLPSPLSAISTISSSIISSYGKCLSSPPLTSPLIGYLLLLPAFSAISSSFSLTRPLRPPGLQVTIGAAD